MRLLVVEDEALLADAIVEGLREEAYAVDLATCGSEASELAAVNPYDLVVLDRSIPPPNGIELLRQWRKEGKSFPVLMLTGSGGIGDRVGGLDAGADDYLTKPYDFAELLARVRSLLRRGHQPYLGELRCGELELNRAGRTVTRSGQPLELRPKEFAVLEMLLNHAGEVVSRTELVEHVWDDSFDSMSNVVDVTLHRVRKQVDGGRDQPMIETVKGVGYRLRCPNA